MLNITRFSPLEDAFENMFRGIPVWLPNPETRAPAPTPFRMDVTALLRQPPRRSTPTACWSSRCQRKPQRPRKGSRCIERRLTQSSRKYPTPLRGVFC
jgi:hypothetical protein